MKPLPWSVILLVVMVTMASGMVVTNHQPEVHDRFSSGFPSAPVANTNAAFVGLGYDWSGVGWAPGNRAKRENFVLVSPQHYLMPNHDKTLFRVTVIGSGGTMYTNDYWKVESTGQGVNLPGTGPDIALGTLSNAVPMAVQSAPYAILDLYSVNNYLSQDALIYGRGDGATASPQIAEIQTAGFFLVQTGGYTNLLTSRAEIQLEDKDSGGPLFLPWTNPLGQPQLTLLGTHASISTDDQWNIHNFIALPSAAAALDAKMIQSGWAMHWVGTPDRTWEGGKGQPAQRNLFNNSLNWGGQSPSDRYVLFDGDNTTHRTPELGGDMMLRGVYFLPAAAGNGFAIQAGHTLTLGKGGITNYDPLNVQVFSNALALAAHQYWDGGEAGLRIAGTIDNQGHLLIVRGAGTNRIEGVLSGDGGLTMAGPGVLELAAENTYTGKTWVAGGLLRVAAASGSATGTGPVEVQRDGILGGSGLVAGPVEVLRGGRLAPGASAGMLELGALTMRPEAVFAVDIYSALDHDSVQVNGGVAVGGAILEVTVHQPLALEEDLTILVNAGGSPVSGFFLGLEENGTFYSGGTHFQISYQGGGGDDIVLTVIPEPGALSLLGFALLALAALRHRRSGRRNGRL